MKYKVTFLLTLAIVVAVSLQAQLNVGSTSPADVSAILQATSTTKGFLPPVMTTTQINAIVLPANGLTVYNTTLSQLQVNVGTPLAPSWAVGAGGANVYWSQVGNTGTVPGTNYVGTTDNASLAFGTNGVERVRIDSATGNVGIGLTTPNAPLQFANTLVNRKIVLTDNGTSAGNDSAFYGFGINAATLRYQVPAGASHTFYSNKTQAARIAPDGQIFVAGLNSGFNFTDRIRTSRQNTLYSSNGITRLQNSLNGDVFTVDSIGNTKITGKASINGNVAIGIDTAYAPLQFANTSVNRKLVLWDNNGISSASVNNDSAFYGLGINGGTLRYQVPTGANHSFYSNKIQVATIGGGGSFSIYGSASGFATNDQTRPRSGGFYVRDGVLRIWQNIAGEAITMDSTGEVTINKRISMNNNASVFIGAGTGPVNTTGGGNSFIGVNAGLNNTTGYYNVFTGFQAGINNTTGNDNVFSGVSAGLNNTTGVRNTITGRDAGVVNTTGNDNIFEGWHAGYNSTGSANTYIGRDAGSGFSAGNLNVAIGYDANTNNASLSNTIVIGNGARVGASNTVVIGNNSMTSIGGYQAWSNLSDARFKYNIKANVLGLAFIQKLRPVTYQLDAKKLDAFTKNGVLNASFSEDANATMHTGFLAQDVEKAANELGISFDGIHAPENDRDHYSLAYAQFVVPLVKGMQEQQDQIEKLTNQNKLLAAQMEVITGQLAKLTSQLNKTPATQAATHPGYGKKLSRGTYK